MKEATEKVIDYAFQTLQFQKIVAHTHNENQNSTKLLTRFNFLQSKEAYKENPDFNIFTLTYLDWQTIKYISTKSPNR